MTGNRVGLGKRGEALAAGVLERHGYRLVDSNWRCARGEVDLILERAEHLYFVEVRTRRGRPYPAPEQTVTLRKRARMESVARTYLGTHGDARQMTWHLSFVAVAMDAAGRLQRITFYPSLEGEPIELIPAA
jgi:putative endonuclease